MLPDPIVEEIRLIRKAHAEKYENDLDRIVEALREEERASPHVFLNPGPKKLSVPRASEQAESYGAVADDTRDSP